MSDLSRREWFQSLLPALGDLAARGLSPHIDRVFPPRRRPPGAVSEPVFLSVCTRCGACSEACPQGAVHTLCEDAGFAAGTPVLFPEQRPCHMCEGFPCVSACPERALLPPAEATWRLGTVRVARERCLAYAGPECGACANLCPPGVDALELSRGRPSVDTAGCVGCGLCIEACPVIPAALELLPLSDEPRR